MGAGYFIIAILGCSDGGTGCTPVATLQPRYASEAQCDAATGAALIENNAFDYPTLVAQCRHGQEKAAGTEKPQRDKPHRG